MKRILELLKGARRIEWIAALIAVAILLMQLLGAIEPAGTQTDLERRLEAILASIEGVGRVEVMVAEDAEGGVEGVLVVAEGAWNAAVCLRIQYAVETLLGIEASAVEVVQRAG